jgi:hypothetical protein
MTMTATEQPIMQDRMMVELPCLGCSDERALAIRLQIGQAYLLLEQQRLPTLVDRRVLMSRCCRRIKSWTFEPRPTS